MNKKLYTQEQKNDMIAFASFARSCPYEKYSDGNWYYHYDTKLYTEEQLLYIWIAQNKLNS